MTIPSRPCTDGKNFYPQAAHVPAYLNHAAIIDLSFVNTISKGQFRRNVQFNTKTIAENRFTRKFPLCGWRKRIRIYQNEAWT
jgi:hypothetical protein